MYAYVCKTEHTHNTQGYVFSSDWMHWLVRVVRCKRRPHNRYKHIMASIEPTWPPVEVEKENKSIQQTC